MAFSGFCMIEDMSVLAGLDVHGIVSLFNVEEEAAVTDKGLAMMSPNHQDT